MNQVNTTLYALNKDGSFQEWKVFTDGPRVVVEFGKLNGKIQAKSTLCEAKNVGRSNETSPSEQAGLEAVSKWEKQVRLGYRESTEELEVEETFSPMLAHDATKRSHDIVYPCYVQPKLDGLRCVVTFDEKGNPVFNSRGNKTYPLRGNIVPQIKVLGEETGFDKFDGEVYIHGLSLQKIVALTKKWRTHPMIAEEIQKDYQNEVKRRNKAVAAGEEGYKNQAGDMVDVSVVPELDDNRYGGYCSEDLEFHIFDIPVNKNSPWYSPDHDCHRLADLTTVASAIQEGWCYSHLRAVPGVFAGSQVEVKDLIAEHMVGGFEGSIIRNFKGVYEFGQRSSDLQKWKIFQDAEALVLSSTEDKNGEGVLNCVTKWGAEFSCKMKGTHAERSQAVMLKLVQKHINFTYQTLTDAGVPQFPVGRYVRAVDSVTWEPLE